MRLPPRPPRPRPHRPHRPYPAPYPYGYPYPTHSYPVIEYEQTMITPTLCIEEFQSPMPPCDGKWIRRADGKWCCVTY